MGNAPEQLRISVIIPNFNHAEFLPNALNALLNQSHKPREIIVIDDASTDNSLEVISRFTAKHSHIVLVKNDTNLGTIKAMNIGLKLARGDLIYFGASDDRVEPRLFENCLKMFDEFNEAALVCTEVKLTDFDGNFLGFRPPVWPGWRSGFFNSGQTANLLGKIDHWIITGASVFRRDLLKKSGGFDPELASMADSFVARKLALQHGFCFVREVGLNWRISSKGLSRSAAVSAETVSGQLKVGLGHILEQNSDVFPPGYARLFERRLKFSTARIVIGNSPIDFTFLNKIVAGGQIDNLIFNLSSIVPTALARPALLVWITLKYRPFSLTRIAATTLGRRVLGYHRKV